MAAAMSPAAPPPSPPAIVCVAPWVVDGDTIRCRNLPARVRLVGIDAPELPGHCNPGRRCVRGNGAAAKRMLIALVHGQRVTVRPLSRDRYDRIVGQVFINGRDASCAMIAARAAVPRYAPLACR